MNMSVTEQDKKKVLRLALFAGEIMLCNGGETYRVEDTILRICHSRNISCERIRYAHGNNHSR